MILFILLFLMSFEVNADPWKDLAHGDKTANEFLKNLDKKKTEAGSHPFYYGKTPKESNLKDAELKGKAQSAALQEQAGQMVYESQNVRSQFKIDPQTDPLLSIAEKIMKTPLTEIGGEGTHVVEVTQGGKDEVLNCEEAGDNSLESCISDLKVNVIKTKVKKEKQDSFRLTGCKKSHKDYHTRSCPVLLSHLLNWRKKRVWKHNGGSIEVTSAYKECLQEVLNQTNTRCYRCNNPRTTVPTDLARDRIKRVIIERDSSGQPLIQGGTNYSKHGRLKTYNLQATIKIFYEEDSYKILPDEWSSNCDHLENRVDQGLCSYASKICSVGKQTRLIEGVSITRDCWQETFTYSCSYPSKNNCGPLRARGCAQINSTCKQMVGKNCVVYNQTYQCIGPQQKKHQIAGGQTPFCMDGNCRDQSWDPNDELGSSLAQLSILKALQGQFKNPSIFKGDDNRCSKYILSFKDCCGSGKGWGNDVGLSSCKKSAKTLSKKRKAGLCHYVGTYCDKKVLSKCIKKKSSFCCFGSKLLKAFHEQGRPQIGLSWGNPKHPLCRGFTINEIQRIDFSKLDLSEIFEDIMKNYKPANLKGVGNKIGERLETIKKGLSPNTKQQPKQRNEA